MNHTVPFKFRFLTVALQAALVAAPAFSQGLGSVPVPGSSGTVNDSRNTQPVPALPGAAASPTAPLAAVPADDGRRIQVKRITVLGNIQLSTEQLLAAAGLKAFDAPQALSFPQIQRIANAMTAAYRAQGFSVATVMLPAQDITDGAIKLQVFEGRLEKTAAKPVKHPVLMLKSSAELSLVIEAGDAAIPQSRRNALRQADVERAVMVAAEVTGTQVEGHLEPGTAEGSTRLNFDVTPLESFSGNVRLDNAGSASTGRTQVQAQLTGRNLATPGDVLNANLLTTEKGASLSSYGLGYELPVGVQGWRLGARASTSEYDLGGTFANKGFAGKSDALGVYTSYALQRRFDAATDVRLGYNKVDLMDRNGTTVLSANGRESDIVWADLRGNYNDTALGRAAYNQWGVSASFGDLAYNTASRQSSDAAGLKTAGGYQVFTADYLRDQVIAGPWSAQVAWRGQVANKNLDSYHKFRLGGANGVRAFAEGEGAGDQGHLLRAELAYTSQATANGAPATSRLAAFYDQGEVDVNHTPLAASTASNKSKRAGYGLQWQWTQRGLRNADQLSLRVFYAEPTGITKRSDADNKASRVGAELGYRF